MKKSFFHKSISGGRAYIAAMQIAAMLPLVYVLIAAGSYSIFTRENAASVLFDLGMTSLPVWSVMLLSLIYHLSLSELAVYFALSIGALIFGPVMKRLLSGRRARIVRYVLMALIAADLAARFLPLRAVRVWPLWAVIAGASVRLACLILLFAEGKKDVQEHNV
ncbi:MAG: hypothetical protein IJS22_07145 [Lachnospiraceae bacterium]|nr:hypothetical protein [Lachnospiraceae bacterium]